MQIATEQSPLVSIVIPVKNGNATIGSCLQSVKRSYYKNIEVIVVDDHSTDGTAETARLFGCTVLQVTDGQGANHARNVGAQSAQGDILLFIDADIMIRRDTILTAVEKLEEGGIDAVVGLYTARHRHENFISQYKNLWVRYSYLKSPAEIDWLFGAISGIKREAFEKIGGFDTGLRNQQGTEDIELGKRFSQAKMNVLLDIDIEVEHLKSYTLWSFINNEFTRSRGFAELAAQLGETGSSLKKGFANVYPTFVFSTLLSVLVLIIIALSLAGLLPPWYSFAMIGFYLVLNIRFLNYLEQVRGLFAMMVMIPILFLDHLVCFIGSVAGVLKGIFKKNKQ
jgi:glycosyltransferase involved in cell wall biosynthesis